MNKKSSYGQNNQSSQISYKTNQNLDRLSKLSERLNNIHLNIESEKYSKYEEIEVRLNNLDESNIEINEINFKTFSQVKEQITKIIQSIEEDKQKYESSYESRTQYITMLEFKLMERFDSESHERKDMEKRLITLIDERYSILKNELSKETKNRNESIENFTFYLESEVPKIVEQMKGEGVDREEGDGNINKVITEEFNKLFMLLSNEKRAREETEEAFLDMLRSIINKIKTEMENERKEREQTEETLLNLLEETCNRLDAASKI